MPDINHQNLLLVYLIGQEKHSRKGNANRTIPKLAEYLQQDVDKIVEAIGELKQAKLVPGSGRRLTLTKAGRERASRLIP